MRIKRICCVALALLITVSIVPVAFAEGGTYMMYDMEKSDERLAFTGGGCYSGGYTTDSDDKGTVFVAGPGATAPTSASNKITIPVALNKKITDKAVISFDVKSYSGAGGYMQIVTKDSNNKSYIAAVMDSLAAKTWVFNNWQNKADVNPIGLNTWSRVDFILDLKNESAELYKDGKLIDSGNKTSNYATLADLSSIEINFFVATEPASDGSYKTEKFMLDNITVSDMSMLVKGESGTVIGSNGEIYITLPSTMSGDSELPESAVISQVGTDIKINSSVSKVNGSICLKPEKKLSEATEYEVIFPEGTELFNFLGMKIDVEPIFETPVKENEAVLMNESFSGAALPDTFAPTDGSGAVVSKEGRLEISDGALRVLPAEWRAGANYTFPDNMPQSYTLKLSYRAKIERSKDGGLGAHFIEIGNGLNTSETMGMTINYDTLTGGGSIAYPDYADYWSGKNRIVLVADSVVDEETWYTYEYEYEINGETRPTVSYKVKDESGAVLGEISGVTTAGKNFVSPEYVRFEYKRPADKGGAALFDDIKISYVSTPNYVRNARIDSLMGEKLVPGNTPSNAMKGMTLTFSKALTDAEVTLTSADGELTIVPEISGKICTIKWSEFLKEQEYTLKVDYGEATP